MSGLDAVLEVTRAHLDLILLTTAGGPEIPCGVGEDSIRCGNGDVLERRATRMVDDLLRLTARRDAWATYLRARPPHLPQHNVLSVHVHQQHGCREMITVFERGQAGTGSGVAFAGLGGPGARARDQHEGQEDKAAVRFTSSWICLRAIDLLARSPPVLLARSSKPAAPPSTRQQAYSPRARAGDRVRTGLFARGVSRLG